MSYNGSGTFNINTTGQPVVAGTVITASAFNALTTDLATGLTTAITKDGQTTTTARITFAQGVTSSLVTDSSSVSTGSIITGGGVGIAKALYVGTTANVAGAVTLGGIATFSAQPIFTSLTASSAVATDASKGLVSVTNTGTGNNVLATAPTIASLNLTTALTIASASGTVGQVLTSGGSGNAPTWSSPSTTSISNGTSNVTVNSSGGSITATTNGTAAVTIDTSQNVGIGTASPSTKLHVVGRLNVVGSIGTISTDSQGLALDLNRAGTTGITNNNASGVLTFGTATNEVMRLDSSGRWMVGTTTALNAGVARGSLLFNSTFEQGLFIATSVASNGQCMGFNYNTSTNVGSINITSSATSYSTSSDYRLKENITPISGALTKVAQLKPVNFKWKTDNSDGQGFIAHELQEVCPDAVTGTKDATREEQYEVTPAVKDEEGNITTPAVMGTRTVPAYQSVDTSFLVATLTAAIQELSAKNDALTARIVALENA